MLTRARKGFTLLELIVVLVILGLLAAIAIPTYQAIIERSEETSAHETAKALARNIQAIASMDRVANVQTANVVETAGLELTTDADVTVDDLATTTRVQVTANNQSSCISVPTSYSAVFSVAKGTCTPAAAVTLPTA